ncbi:MAG: 5-demethoxyubiquinol-8 5-hydroxylase UbiM [Hyphomicrobium sp.]
MQARYDMVIVGAGPAGLSLACLAGAAGLKIAIVDEQREEQIARPAYDGRDIALTHRSVECLKQAGVWSAIADADVAPISNACVKNADEPALLRFDPGAMGEKALGYLVSNQVLRAALYAGAKARDSIELVTGATATAVELGGTAAKVSLATGDDLAARLVVAADSRFSKLRRMAGIGADLRDFGRVCIVCRIKHEQAHDGTAYEWFDTDQTLAVLPLNNRESSIVLTLPATAAARAMELPAPAFAADVERRFARRWGAMELSGARHAYPLVGVYADRFVAKRFALIGDAAVGMHPVTAHGFNFGLRGAASLAVRVSAAARAGVDIGSASLLEAYDREHRRATFPLYVATNALVRLYTDNGAAARLARSGILRLGERMTPIKNLMLRRLMEVDTRPALT